MPEQTTYSADDAPNVLATVYPLATSWDEDEKVFVCELPAFDLQVHGASWQAAIDTGKAAQEWLIGIYQTRNFTLPNL